MYLHMNIGLIVGTISDQEKTLEYIYIYLSHTHFAFIREIIGDIKTILSLPDIGLEYVGRVSRKQLKTPLEL